MTPAAAPAGIDMLIIQPSPFCNIDCSYCYLPNRSNSARMPLDLLGTVFQKILGSAHVNEHTVIVWHAGEPLAVPTTWYDEAFARADAARQPGHTHQHAFQSNGMLVDDRWIAFLQRTGARISLSIDGPAWLHDTNRRTRSGAGTHARAMQGLARLHAAGIRPSIIAVLTRPALDHPDELFDFFRDAGLTDLAFNIEEIEGAHDASTLQENATTTAYRTFMQRFIARMREHPGAIRLREVRDALAVLRTGVPLGTNQEAEPLRIVSVAHDGQVSSFSPELLGLPSERYGNYVFGNLETEDFETIAARILASPLAQDIATGLANCRRTCGWFPWCGGGPPSNKIFETGTPLTTETLYCRLTRQTLLDVVMTELEQTPATAELA